MNKKVYQQPNTLTVAIAPQSIICTSPGGSTNPMADMLYGGKSSGFGGE
jgi:hypothetical protein